MKFYNISDLGDMLDLKSVENWLYCKYHFEMKETFMLTFQIIILECYKY